LTAFKKIALYGDSLSMARENVVKYNQRYFYLLKKLVSQNFIGDFEIIEKAKASIPITDLKVWVKHDSVYYQEKGDIFILHCGIVDCAPRPVNIETRNKISVLPNFLKKIVVKYIHKNRAKLISSNGGYRVTENSVFEENYNEIIDFALLQYEKVFLINICPTDIKTESHSPGLQKSIDEYNSIIKKIVEKKSSNKISLIDINSIVKSKPDIYSYMLTDGHHITPSTHELIFNEISSKI
jgi:hypothetical protein